MRTAEPGPGRQIACMEVWGGNGPAEIPVSLPGNDAFVSCRPWKGHAAGGDIYYLSSCMSGIITRFVLADIAGHGQQSSDLALSLRRLMRKHINTADQTAFARALNREFGELASVGRFATALIATYFAPTDHLIVCNAGHPPPLIRRAGSKRWALLTGDSPGAVPGAAAAQTGVPNLPLGILESGAYEQFATRLQPEDTIVMYTDALIEAATRSREPLGTHGMLSLCEGVAQDDPASIAREILDRVTRESGRPELDDDATILVLRHNAQDPPRQGVIARARTLGRLIGLD